MYLFPCRIGSKHLRSIKLYMVHVWIVSYCPQTSRAPGNLKKMWGSESPLTSTAIIRGHITHILIILQRIKIKAISYLTYSALCRVTPVHSISQGHCAGREGCSIFLIWTQGIKLEWEGWALCPVFCPDHQLLYPLLTAFFNVPQDLSMFLKTQIHNPTGWTGGSVLYNFDGAGTPYKKTTIFSIVYMFELTWGLVQHLPRFLGNQHPLTLPSGSFRWPRPYHPKQTLPQILDA